MLTNRPSIAPSTRKLCWCLFARLGGTCMGFERRPEVGIVSDNLPSGWLVSVSRRGLGGVGRCFAAYATRATNERGARTTILAAVKPREGDTLHRVFRLNDAVAAALQLRAMRVRQLTGAELSRLSEHKLSLVQNFSQEKRLVTSSVPT